MKLLSDLDKDLLKLAYQKLEKHKIEMINLTAVFFVVSLLLLLLQKQMMNIVPSVLLSMLPFVLCLFLSSALFYVYMSIYTGDFKNLKKVSYLLHTIKEIIMAIGLKVILISVVFVGAIDGFTTYMSLSESSHDHSSEPSELAKWVFYFALFVMFPLAMFFSNLVIMNIKATLIGMVGYKIGIKTHILQRHLVSEYLKPILKYSLVVGTLKAIILFNTNYLEVFEAFVMPLNVFFITIMVLYSLGERPKVKEESFSGDLAMQF